MTLKILKGRKDHYIQDMKDKKGPLYHPTNERRCNNASQSNVIINISSLERITSTSGTLNPNTCHFVNNFLMKFKKRICQIWINLNDKFNNLIFKLGKS